jgi:hypothetical protein
MIRTTALFLALAAAPAFSAVNFVYSGYGSTGDMSTEVFGSGSVVTVAGSAWSTGNVDTSGTSGNATVNLRPTYAFNASGSAQRTLTAMVSGSGTNTMTGSSLLTSSLTGIDWNDGSNRQLNGGHYIYNAFTVDTTGQYTVTMNLNSGPNSATLNGGYTYYGLGGDFSVTDGGTTVWELAGNTGNIGDPAAGVVRTYTSTLSLTAGTTYQLNFDSYQYAGFGGPTNASYTTGWSYSIASVPEPSRVLLLGLGSLGLMLRRSRRAALST